MNKICCINTVIAQRRLPKVNWMTVSVDLKSFSIYYHFLQRAATCWAKISFLTVHKLLPLSTALYWFDSTPLFSVDHLSYLVWSSWCLILFFVPALSRYQNVMWKHCWLLTGQNAVCLIHMLNKHSWLFLCDMYRQVISYNENTPISNILASFVKQARTIHFLLNASRKSLQQRISPVTVSNSEILVTEPNMADCFQISECRWRLWPAERLALHSSSIILQLFYVYNKNDLALTNDKSND